MTFFKREMIFLRLNRQECLLLMYINKNLHTVQLFLVYSSTHLTLHNVGIHHQSQDSGDSHPPPKSPSLTATTTGVLESASPSPECHKSRNLQKVAFETGFFCFLKKSI